ncbi:MAG: cytochrome c peroxidase [Pseudomonadota bacterium]
MKKILFSTAVFSLVLGAGYVFAADLTPIEDLGKKLYESNKLSLDETQSCATCHHGTSGFADPTNSADPVNVMVSLGDDLLSTGGRNAPTAAYCGFSPVLHVNQNGEYVGGMFWDGRATGYTLGDPLAEQAQGPPLNPVEMHMPNKEAVIVAIQEDTAIVDLFEQVFGLNPFDQVETAYDNMAIAIAAYERSAEVTRFTSDYDTGTMSRKQQKGASLFIKNCAKCHSVERRGSGHPLFTNYQYVNAGVPMNEALLVEGCAYEYPDLGLGGFLNDPAQNGKFKVPTLRNIALTAPYSHNGYFANLRDMVSFMNNNSGYTPEVADNLSTAVGNLGLSDAQIDEIVVFLESLTDK